MGQIFAFYTCTRVKWESEDQDYPDEEHGWIDRAWNSRELCESRNDVRPYVNLDESDEGLADDVREALDWLDGGWEDNGDGTFYARQEWQPYDDDWDYSYALHFTRKFRGDGGWVEVPWHPVRDGGIDLNG